MTYNVHSCIGRDKVSSPERIADVIAHYGPDIVALQELDVDLSRSGMVDQARVIADHLNMHFHFHPSFSIEEGFFGNAVLSRYPIQLIKADELPTFRHRTFPEKRGALWVKLYIEGNTLNLVNTHLGLNRRERKSQIDMLLGPEWTGNHWCTPPAILCGDLNASPLSGVCRKIRKKFNDAQKLVHASGPRSTWPSRFPFMRIDHVLVSSGIAVTGISVPKTALTKAASDHLPIVVHLDLP